MSKPVIFSVRHGESVTNVSRSLHRRISDPEVWLTQKGHDQARQSAQFLAQYLDEMLSLSSAPRRIRIMRSPYRRAIQTAQYFIDKIKKIDHFHVEVKEEDARLRELEFGFADGAGHELPEYVKYYSDLLRYQGHKYYSRRYGGESPADVEVRVRSVLDAIFRDYTEHRIDAFIVVSHGLTARVLTKVRYQLSNEWYENEPNPDNCSIRYLGTGRDHGYVFPNPAGQWDPDFVEVAEAGDPKYNPNGIFFSPRQIEFLIDRQAIEPEIMKIINDWIVKHPERSADDIFNMLFGKDWWEE
jgi:broad specificity phosphatase PhoE